MPCNNCCCYATKPCNQCSGGSLAPATIQVILSGITLCTCVGSNPAYQVVGTAPNGTYCLNYVSDCIYSCAITPILIYSYASLTCSGATPVLVYTVNELYVKFTLGLAGTGFVNTKVWDPVNTGGYVFWNATNNAINCIGGTFSQQITVCGLNFLPSGPAALCFATNGGTATLVMNGC